MKSLSCIMSATLLCAAPFAAAMAGDSDRSVLPVRFAADSSSTLLKGRIKGDHYIDYQLRAGAGQSIKASLKGSNRANYFNVLAPGSNDVAMFIGDLGDNRFEGVLPTDGTYTLRVYLMRSAARRGETSDFSLNVAVTGKALKALPGAQDAKVAGTLYHATTQIPCAPPYDPATKQCDAGVIRRGTDGTATVEVRAARSYLRRVLFVQGKPVASDAAQVLAATRRGDVTEIRIGQEERFDVPEALVAGG